MKSIIILSIIVVLFGAGCNIEPERYHDEEKQVTCWDRGTGLFCIPDSQLPTSTAK